MSSGEQPHFIHEQLIIRSEYPTQDGGTIFLSPNSIEHLTAHPEIAQYLEEAISKVQIPTDGSALITEVEMGRPVGKAGCVDMPYVSLTDKTTFAFRKARQGASRVALVADTPDISTVVIWTAPRDQNGKITLVTAYVGNAAPHEPWGAPIEERERALEYWSTHALVYKPEVMGQIFESTFAEVCRHAAENIHNP